MLTRGLLEPGRSANYLKYALWGQRRVDGWLEELGLIVIDAMDGVQRQAGITGGVAEIGIHHGRLFILLSLMRRPGESAVAIDLFEDQHLNLDLSGRGDREQFEANLRKWDPQHADVQVVKANSWGLDGEALRQHAGGPLRFVSIDGGHMADLTAHDLATACDAIGDGGVVILDDCFNAFFPSVSEGAQTFLRRRTDFTAFFTGGNKTLICHAEFSDRYRQAMRVRIEGRPITIADRTFLDHQIIAVEPLYPRWERLYWRRYALGRLRAALRG